MHLISMGYFFCGNGVEPQAAENFSQGGFMACCGVSDSALT
ncbi:hypothetical protein BN132_1503 [Cronobacter turicensis 564]|nr:hypothetical protein BN132_1503 [Cronobacter turicensis 564]